MTFDIRIGEAVPPTDPDPPSVHDVVEIQEDPGAPTFAYDHYTGQTNRRDTPMVAWEAFARDTGLHDLFFHRDHGLLRYPSQRTVSLTRAHLEQVTRAREQWVTTHPAGGAPGWNYPDLLGPPPHLADDGVRGRDPHLARLLWLEWWMARALAQCHRPAIAIR